MQFNLNNQAKHPNLLNVFPEYPCFECEIRTPQSLVLVPPPQNNPLLTTISTLISMTNMLNSRLSPNIHVAHLCGMSSSTSSVISQSFKTKCFHQDIFLNTPIVPYINTAYGIRSRLVPYIIRALGQI